MIKEAIFARLSADAGVTALSAGRIYPGRRDQGSGLPAVVYHLISAPRRRTLQGRTSMTFARVQIDCWGDDEDAADQMGKAVKATLEGARFDHGDARVRGVFLIDEADDAGSGDGTVPFRTRLDFRVSLKPA